MKFMKLPNVSRCNLELNKEIDMRLDFNENKLKYLLIEIGPKNVKFDSLILIDARTSVLALK